MKKVIIGLFLVMQGLCSQAQGIVFETGTWKEVVEKAKKLNKPIFIDVYTSWCGPCRVMAATTFMQPEIGAQYNDGFVNVKIDAEKGEGIDLAKKYEVKSYPTYLFVDPNDESLVGVGKSSMPTDVFADLGERMSNTYHKIKPVSLKELTAQFNKGNYDEAFLKKYIRRMKAEKANVSQALETYNEKHMATNATEDQLFFLATNYNGGNELYDYLIDNYKRLDAIVCKKDGLAASNFDAELMRETDRQMKVVMGDKKLSLIEKEVALNRYFDNIRVFATSESNADRKILGTLVQFYYAEKDTAKIVKTRREFITKLVLPDELTSRINRTPFMIDKNEGEPVTGIDSVFAANAASGYAGSLLNLSKEKEDIDLAIKVYQKAQRLTPSTLYYTCVVNMTQYNYVDKKKAIKEQTATVKKMQQHKDEYLADAQRLLQQMKAGQANVSLVHFKLK